MIDIRDSGGRVHTISFTDLTRGIKDGTVPPDTTVRSEYVFGDSEWRQLDQTRMWRRAAGTTQRSFGSGALNGSHGEPTTSGATDACPNCGGKLDRSEDGLGFRHTKCTQCGRKATKPLSVLFLVGYWVFLIPVGLLTLWAWRQKQASMVVIFGTFFVGIGTAIVRDLKLRGNNSKEGKSTQESARAMYGGTRTRAAVETRRPTSNEDEDIVGWYNHALVLAENGQHREAVKCYDRILESNTDDADTWYGKGASLTELKQYAMALSCFAAAIRLNPDDPDPYYGKALAEDKLGRKESALRDYRHYLARASKDDEEQIRAAKKRLQEMEPGR